MPVSLKQLPEQLPHIRFRAARDMADRDPGFHPENLSAELMVLPGSAAEVSEVLALCHANRIPVVTQGGRTGLSGGAATTPEQLIMDTCQMRHIESIHPESATAVVQCGVTLSVLEAAAGTHGLTAGIDLSARDSATLGGMAATNAGGISAHRNGMMRHRILGLEAVLADGKIYRHLRRVAKANEGPDIGQLFIGSEGTLGVITRLSLTLLPIDSVSTTALVVCPDVSCAVQSYRQMRQDQNLQLLAVEAMWSDYAITVAHALSIQLPIHLDPATRKLLVLFEYISEPTFRVNAFEQVLARQYELGLMTDIVIAKNQRESHNMWRIREDSFMIDSIWPHGFWYDISVPLEHLAQYVDSLFDRIQAISPELKIFLIAHLGDGNIHATITAGKLMTELKKAVDAAVYCDLATLGGSFSAEHGIGTDKRQALANLSSPVRYQMLQQFKNLLDPNGILNPGKIIP